MDAGWMAGVPQRVLDEFSKRTEQVEQKAKELGITAAKGKDGLAAMRVGIERGSFTVPSLTHSVLSGSFRTTGGWW
jgi:hypothetical protein